MDSEGSEDHEPGAQNGGALTLASHDEDPRGFHELSFVGEDTRESEQEVDEQSLGPDFDSYEDTGGDKLRLLDSFTIFHEDGRQAPPSALDGAKERGQKFVVFGTVVAPLTTDARAKLISLDVRLKGRIPPCLPKSLEGGAPEALPWITALSLPAPTAKGGTNSKGGRGSSKKSRPRTKANGKKPPPGPEPLPGGKRSASTVDPSGGSGTASGGNDGEGGRHGDMRSSVTPSNKRPRKGNGKCSQEESPDIIGKPNEKTTDRQIGYPLPPHQLLGAGISAEGRGQNGSSLPPAQRGGVSPGTPKTKAASGPSSTSAHSKDGITDGNAVPPQGGNRKRKAGESVGSASAIANKRVKPPPSFSLATFVGGLDGSETRGVPGAEFVGASFRRGRKDGLLLYYVDKAPRDYPFEYESKAAGAASLDWSYMRKHLKVDAFCMETFRWYGAKVAEVSVERQQVKVHFNGWKSKFDEWMDWESFRLAPCGSRSSAKREGEQASGPVKKESSTRCVLVPARRTARIRITTVDDWCIDHSDPAHPVMWLISPNAWYKVAGATWWDFVAPHPLYAEIFEPARRGFAVACLIARCLRSSPMASFASVARRVAQMSSSVFEAPQIIDYDEIVATTVVGMGNLSTRKGRDNEGGGADGDDAPYGGTWLVSNGESEQQPDSIPAKDTLFLKELRAKVQEREARATRQLPRSGGRRGSSPPRSRLGNSGTKGSASNDANESSRAGAGGAGSPGSPGTMEPETCPDDSSPNLRRSEVASGTRGGGKGGGARGGAGTRASPEGAANAARAAAASAHAAASAKARAEKERIEKEKKEAERLKKEMEKERRETERQKKEIERQRREQEREKEKAERAMEKAEKAMEKALAKKAAMERKAQEKADEAAAKKAAMERKVQERQERQRQIAEEKERIRKAKEAERLAKMEAKRLEKEAKDRERAEAQARDQARREIEREKARLAKRYPLPDEELWDEQRELGKIPAPWPEADNISFPAGFPTSAFWDAVSSWACLQLFGPLMHMQRFSLEELMIALSYDFSSGDEIHATGVRGSVNKLGSSGGANDGSSVSIDMDVDSESLLDVIPAPVQHFGEDGDEASLSAGPNMLANIHMRVLNFLAWDRLRGLRCALNGEQEAYWKSLLPHVSWGGGGSGGSAGGVPSMYGSGGTLNCGQQGDSTSGPETGGSGGGMMSPLTLGFQNGDDEEFRGAPETTLAGLRDSRELLQASPHGWPELLRLVAMKREGVLDSADSSRVGLSSASIGGGEEPGVTDFEGRQKRALLRARHLDPLGEVLRILRHVARMEEARALLSPPSDMEVDPDGLQAAMEDVPQEGENHEDGVVLKQEEGDVSDDGERRLTVKKEDGEARDVKGCVKRPLDLGTIVKRVESGWYDLEAISEPPVASKSFGAGHAGVAHDIELMQQGWLEVRGADSIIYEQARIVVDEFLSLYETHVLAPLGELENAEKTGGREYSARTDLPRPGTNVFLDHEIVDEETYHERSEGEDEDEVEDWRDTLIMLRHMSMEEYANWSSAERSRALAWLCDEAMSAATINDLVKKVLEAREIVDRRDREVKAAVRQKIREQEAREASGSHSGSASLRRGTEAEMIAARVGSESPEMKVMRQLGSVKVRLKPLGVDRDRRRYWLFALGEDHRLFTELAGEWGCYARVSQLKMLHKWLDRRGIRERTLKAAIREHLITNLGVNAEELDPPERPSGYRARRDEEELDEDEDEDQQYLGEPAEVAREKERERNAGREALRQCGFAAEDQRFVLQTQCLPFAVDLCRFTNTGLAFEQKMDGYVMRDVAVEMSPDGLGLQLDVSNGGLVVCGHTLMPEGIRNPGEDAGIEVGDLLISVNNIVAETPRALTDSLQQEASSLADKLVVIKVLSPVQLTDASGEPAQGALDFKPINILKGTLLEAETRLHHGFVIGKGWEGQVCREWRLAVAFAGQGIGESWGHGATLSSSEMPRSIETTSKMEVCEEGTEGGEPALEGEGLVELGPDTPDDGRMAVAEVGKRMLQLEARVAKQDTVVDARWGHFGRRRKWRTFVGKAQTAAQLLAAWSAFREVIDWKAAKWCYSDLDRRSFLSLLPAHARNSMPDVGDPVLYYGDGHAQSVETERKVGQNSAWSSDPPIPGAVLQYTVKSITYHQGGSSRRAKGAHPFTTMELEPMTADESESPRTELGLLPASEPFGTLNRLLKRPIKAMREKADVEHFLVPVSRSIYPDYYDVISEPMDLGKLAKRCSACRYRTVEEFKRDLSLVASNCRLYCQDKFPNLPPAADAAVKVGMETLDEPELAAMLAKTVEEGNRLEALWNKHMSAAISASPELATMPGMKKLARQLGFSTDDDGDEDDNEEDSDEDGGQPDAARIARQVFYDKLVGIKYGVVPVDTSNDDTGAVKSFPKLQSTASNGGPPAPSENQKLCEASSPSLAMTSSEESLIANPESGRMGDDGLVQKPTQGTTKEEVGDLWAGTVLRVSMRLSNEMPEFVVVKSKYEEAVRFQWRSEMHIQMAFMDEPGEPPRIYEGSLVGIKAKDPKTGLMPWESIVVEWDDETEVNTINPWEVEAVSAATAAARRRTPGV